MVQLRLNKSLFDLTLANMTTHDMRIDELLKSAPYAQNHASDETAATGGMRMLGDAYHEHDHIKCGHIRPTIMQIRHHAPEHDHPTGCRCTRLHTPPVHRDLAPSLLSNDGARAARASKWIGKLIGARLGSGGRLAVERSRLEAYRSSVRPLSTIWLRHRESTKSSKRLKRPAATTAAVTVVGSKCSATFSTTSCRPQRGRPAPRAHNGFCRPAARTERDESKSFIRRMEGGVLHAPNEGRGMQCSPAASGLAKPSRGQRCHDGRFVLGIEVR